MKFVPCTIFHDKDILQALFWLNVVFYYHCPHVAHVKQLLYKCIPWCSFYRNISLVSWHRYCVDTHFCVSTVFVLIKLTLCLLCCHGHTSFFAFSDFLLKFLMCRTTSSYSPGTAGSGCDFPVLKAATMEISSLCWWPCCTFSYSCYFCGRISQCCRPIFAVTAAAPSVLASTAAETPPLVAIRAVSLGDDPTSFLVSDCATCSGILVVSFLLIARVHLQFTAAHGHSFLHIPLMLP